MEYGIYTDLSNEKYHEDNGYLSSSQLKKLLDSPELFYKTYIKKEKGKEEKNDNLDVGTAIHMRILEPLEYEKKVTYFTGTRRGKTWEAFKLENAGKLILGDLQKIQIDNMYESFIKSELGLSLISNGQSEISLFTSLNDKKIKVRADYLDSINYRIFDLKSTTGFITEDRFQKMVESKFLGYDLQAALYVDAFSLKNSQMFTIPKIHSPYEFYWIVMSKNFHDIKFFKASNALIEQGRQKYKQAFALYDKYEKEGWNFKNSIIELQPSNQAMMEF